MSQRENFNEKARRLGLKVTNFTPATGIGKFDAHYDPTANLLTITLKIFYTFINLPGKTAWTGADQVDFKRKYKEVIEGTWSDCYTIASDKAEWRDLYARVAVKVEEVGSRGAAHYMIEASNYDRLDTARSGIKRLEWTGCFSKWDVYAEEKERRDKGALAFKMEQVRDKIAAAGADYIAFPANSSAMSGAQMMPLQSLATSTRSIISKEVAESEFAFWVYGKIGASENAIRNVTTGKNRAKAVAEQLRAKFPGAKVNIVESSTKEPWILPLVNKILQAHKFSQKDIQSRSFPGVIVLVKDPGLGMNLTTGMQRNYIVAVHETGHMFGLPDEYFGVNCMNMEKQIDLLSTVPEALRALTRLRKEGDRYEPGQAEGFAALLKNSNVPSPVFMNSTSPVTTSIMYAGSDVLPAHYLTFWEALLNVCWPHFNPAEWKIVPNKAGEGKHSNVEFFAR
jgi:hypothetical protein